MVGGRGDTSERTGAIRWYPYSWGIGCRLCNTFPSPVSLRGIAFVSPSLINHTRTWLSPALCARIGHNA